MERRSFFELKNFWSNLKIINYVGEFQWRTSWGHLEVVLIPIVCIIALIFNKLKIVNEIPVSVLMIIFLLLFFSVLFIVKLWKSKVHINNKIYEKNEEILKNVYFTYLAIYYSISAIFFFIIYKVL